MTRLVIASQFGEEFDNWLRAARPDIECISLPPVLNWPLPPDVSVLLAVPVSAEERAKARPAGWPFQLRWVQLGSTGFNNYPPWMLHGPLVTSAHGTSTETIADFVLACLLQRALRLEERRVRARQDWRRVEAPALAGSTLGLFGFGGIGRALARRALVLGIRVIAARRQPGPLGMDGVEKVDGIEALMAASDHLALVAPGTEETRHVVNARTLALARPGLHLINVARGSLVDQQALLIALNEGRVGWASLDVTEPEPLPEHHPLYVHPRVFLTSHTCGISPQVRKALFGKFLRSLGSWETGGMPEDPIDLERGY